MRLLVLVLLLALIGCGAPPAERQILGSWRLVIDQGNGRSSFLVWTFDDGRFTLEGYPPLRQEGRYRLIGTDEAGALRLLLTQQSGDFGSADDEILVLAGADGTLTIDGQGPFQRVEP